MRRARDSTLRIGGLCAAVLAALGSCASSTTIHDADAASRRGAVVMIRDLDVPAVRGIPGAGAQALAAVIAYHDRELVAEDVADALPWHELEAPAMEIVAFAEPNGLAVRPVDANLESLARAIDQDWPVMALLAAGDDRGGVLGSATPTTRREWVVILGVDSARRSVLVGLERHRVMEIPSREFFRRIGDAGPILLAFSRQ